jgi:hypothetical protein
MHNKYALPGEFDFMYKSVFELAAIGCFCYLIREWLKSSGKQFVEFFKKN